MSATPNSKDNPQNDIAEVEALLREAGEAKRAMGRELARRLTVPAEELLREKVT